MSSDIAQHLRDAAQALSLAANAIEQDAGASRGPTAPRTPAPRPAPPRPPPSRGPEPVVPFGRCKGQLLSEIDDASLTWLATALETSVGDPSKVMYRRKNERDLADVRDEQNRRFVR
jgi:hypothetical protein